MLESRIETRLVRGVVAAGGMCIKFKAYRRGWPDRSAYWPNGVHDLIETKRPKGGRWEPLQLRTHTRLRALGHNVFVILTFKEVDKYISHRKQELADAKRKRKPRRI